MMSIGSILGLFVIVLLFAFMMKKGGGGCCGGGKEKHNDHSHGESQGGKKIDPVCNMEVDPETAEHKSDYKGKTVFFCSAHCREKFEKDPESFAEKGVEVSHQEHGCCH
ncbi:YHS domain-containing protein [Thermodesulfobacteriota bacterium]